MMLRRWRTNETNSPVPSSVPTVAIQLSSGLSAGSSRTSANA